MRGLIFNIQKFSINDGPGIRTTVFLKGCPLNCLWCHNPEGISSEKQFIVIENRCISCGKCIEVCPDNLGDSSKFHQSYNKCKVCGECVKFCPTEARQIVGTEIEDEQLTREILKDRIFFDDDGGVTFSGGEPLKQFDFLISVLEKLRRNGIHTAIDTCGYAHPDIVRSAAKVADLFLFDLKFISSQKHKLYTGTPNDVILENLLLLNAIHKNIWLRIPVIEGINTDESEIERIARFIDPLNSIKQINLLPYHKIGINKAMRIKDDKRANEYVSPSYETLDRIKQILKTSGKVVNIGG
ncbi:MAG TPA: glycyl-radical enzyme activating protein [Verrucomicrobiota bacterium]|nr:glycyl-radical enzyme activating protein [Verrucomicrobiota bacterium]